MSPDASVPRQPVPFFWLGLRQPATLVCTQSCAPTTIPFLERPIERPSPCRRSPHTTRLTWLLEMPLALVALTRSSIERVEMAPDVSFLDDGGERPSRPCGAAPGSEGSRSFSSAWGCAAPPCRHTSPSTISSDRESTYRCPYWPDRKNGAVRFALTGE